MHTHSLHRVPLLLFLALCVSAAELSFDDVAFTARCDGSEQRYILGLPTAQETDRPRDALIALHGHGSDRWQFVREERGECAAPRHIAQERGMLFISPDYRAKTSWMGPKAEADLLQIIEEVREKYEVTRFFICGGSMGASGALTFAALHPELLAGVAAMNGTANHLEYENYQDAIQASFGGTKAEIPEEYKKRSAEYWPERFTMPLAMSLSGQDKAVPPQSSLRLAEVLQKLDRKVLVIYREEQGHFSTYEDTRALVEYILAQANAITKEP